MENRKAVLVLDGGERASLAITRSLGKRGIDVVVGESFTPNLAGSSRYCKRTITYASPVKNPSLFKIDIIDEIEKGLYRLIIPVKDVTTSLVAHLSPDLNPYVSLPISDAETVATVQDKEKVYLLAKSLKIPCPLTFLIRSQEQLGELSHTLRYPVIIKPRYSWFFKGNQWVKDKVNYAFNREDLLSKYAHSHAIIPYPMIQELSLGAGRGFFTLMDKGNPVAFFEHLRLREKPPWGGESVLCQSVPIDPQLQAYSLKLLQPLHWHGVAMVEFKNNSEGSPQLMEINGRPWGSFQLAIDAGVDFPYLWYRMATEKQKIIFPSYDEGVKNRWLLGDLESLSMLFFRRAPSFWNRQKTRGVIDFFTPCKSFYDIFATNDIKPWFIEIYQKMKRLSKLFY